jgi:hypothetical protein
MFRGAYRSARGAELLEAPEAVSAILSGERKCVDANPAGICGRLLPDDGGVLSPAAGAAQGQLKPTKIRATTATSTARARKVSMAAVPGRRR